MRSHDGPCGPEDAGVSPLSARRSASHHVVRSSSRSAAIAWVILRESSWCVSPSSGWSGRPYRTEIGGRPGFGQFRPFGIAAYAPRMPIGTTGI